MRTIHKPTYRIPQILATSCYDEFRSGASKPLLVRGRDIESGEVFDAVVKPMGSDRMDVSAATREYLATFIAYQFGLNVVMPVVIHIENKFSESQRAKPWYSRLRTQRCRSVAGVCIEANTINSQYPLD